MSPAGRPKSDNPKSARLEIRLTELVDNELTEMAKRMKMSKTAILLQGLRLVELQQKNPEFHDLSDCLIIREIVKKQPISDDDKRDIMAYIGLLKKRYEL